MDKFKFARHQGGFVLLTALIFMIALTILSLAGLRVSIMEERMTGSGRDRNTAFQAAESALRGAEKYLGQAALPVFDGKTDGTVGANAGLYQRLFKDGVSTASGYPFDGGDIQFWNDWEWSGSCATTKRCLQSNVNMDPAKIGKPGYPAELPKYVIEELPPIPAPGSTGAFVPLPDSQAFRITARGVGGNLSTVVILQSTFKR